MFGRISGFCALILVAGFVTFYPSSQVVAEDAVAWRVSKSSGQVWTTTTGVQEASLTSEAALKPGDTIRTGSNGRVLLVRGEASMLIAPNSVITLPAEQKDGLSTTIYEQAGSVIFHAEKRNFKHFQVETPYLAAVVKGTQFRVTLDKRGANVAVLGGQVEVTDFKTGQNALVLPGQAARVSAAGHSGLSLSGPGIGRVKQGTPRPSPFEQIRVPKGGLAMPAGPSDGKPFHTLGAIDLANNNSHVGVGHDKNVIRITAPLGDVTLDFVKATDGLAHGAIATPADRGHASKQTVWSNDALTPGNGASKSAAQASNSNAVAAGVSNASGNGNGNANGIGNGVANALGDVSAAVDSVAVGKGNGNGNAFGYNNGLALGHLKIKGKL